MSPCGYGHEVPCHHVSMWIWTDRYPGGYVSPCLYVCGMSPCFHVDMDMEMSPMSPCGYGHGVSPMSPCGYRHRSVSMCSMWIYGHGVSPCIHVDTDTECHHVSMWIWTWSVSMFLCQIWTCNVS